MKRALIIGVTGQDGSYLTEYLLARDYEVHGVVRRSSLANTGRIEFMLPKAARDKGRLILHYGDLLDGSAIATLIRNLQPEECYNLGAQSHVQVSFQLPDYTLQVNTLGALRLLEALRVDSSKTKLYNAASSEVFGNGNGTTHLNEDSKMIPASPYGVSKLSTLHLTSLYRDAYGLYAVNGILFNHESPRRGETFVTQKIVRSLVSIFKDGKGKLLLGNLNAIRDWGHAKDYVVAMHLMLQQASPKDYVVATGKTHSVRDFVQIVCNQLGEKILWRGGGEDESVYSPRLGREIVGIDRSLFRRLDVDHLLGDASAIRTQLGWAPTISFEELVAEMVESEKFRSNVNNVLEQK